jgi:hypothetical protein
MVIPRIVAFASPAMLTTLSDVARATGYNYRDVENAPIQYFVPVSPPDGK